MYSVFNCGDNTTKTYEYIEDILRDYIDEDDVEESINDLYPLADVEGHKFPVGSIYRHCGEGDFWNAVVEDFIEGEAAYIEDELAYDSEWAGYGIMITVLNKED